MKHSKLNMTIWRDSTGAYSSRPRPLRRPLRGLRDKITLLFQKSEKKRKTILTLSFKIGDYFK
jgi:hypothetical protein